MYWVWLYMDFYVYDNIYTYNKRNPFNGNVNSRLEINAIDIPENHSFWFHTDMQRIEDNVNINKRYVHIHPGIGKTNKPTFNSKPFEVKRNNIYYNPKEKRVEIGGGLFRKPVFAKKCIYVGSQTPKKKMSILGQWIFDFGNNTINFILDYNIQKIKFEWEDISDDPSRAEQLTKIAKLELEIEEKERIIAQRNSDRESDL